MFPSLIWFINDKSNAAIEALTIACLSADNLLTLVILLFHIGI